MNRELDGQVAIVHEVVLSKPHEVGAQAVEPLHLFDNLVVEDLVANPGARGIAKVVADTDTQLMHGLGSLQASRT